MRLASLTIIGLLAIQLAEAKDQLCYSNWECNPEKQLIVDEDYCCLYEERNNDGAIGITQTCRTASYYNYYFNHESYNSRDRIWTNEYDPRDTAKIYCISMTTYYEETWE